MDNSDLKVEHNETNRRFEIRLGDDAAFIDYAETRDNVLAMTHTEVPPEFEGKGVGSRLVKGALEIVKAEGLRVRPDCPFVAAYIKRHSEYESLVA